MAVLPKCSTFGAQNDIKPANAFHQLMRNRSFVLYRRNSSFEKTPFFFYGRLRKKNALIVNAGNEIPDMAFDAALT